MGEGWKRAVKAVPTSSLLRDGVYLYFSATLAPGERAEMRPNKAVRHRARLVGTEVKYTSEEVPVAALGEIEPFRAYRIGPINGDAASLVAWHAEREIYFTAVYLDGSGKSDLVGEAIAWLVSHGGPFSTSPSAACVKLVVENRGRETVTFAGQVEGATPSEMI